MSNAISFCYSHEVKQALAIGKPIIALESNVICHGFTYPENIQLADAIEKTVRDQGCTPAIIGLDKGKALIGMERDQLMQFTQTPTIPKVSNRDLCFILATKQQGATTVASSMLIAQQAGLHFFASAGLGGVHRDGHQSMDISADLIQLTRSKLIVVCAGVKNILDVGRTLEYLETQGVPIASFQHAQFPAFFCCDSGYQSPYNIEKMSDLIRIIATYQAMPNDTPAFVIAKPMEAEHALDSQPLNECIQSAIESAQQQGICGKDLTKVIMKSVEERTHGKTNLANKQVVLSNAKFASQLALEYSLHTQTQAS